MLNVIGAPMPKPSILASLFSPKSLKRITHVFRDNKKLITAKLGTGLTSLNIGSFYNCQALKTVSGGANIKTIYNECFRYCAALETASDLQPLKVKGFAFDGAKMLQSFNFADITDLGEYAFRNCQALKSVELPKISSMSWYCFNGCSSLTTVKMGDKITYIPTLHSATSHW